MDENKNFTILVVDDDPETTQYFRGIFQKTPYTVYYAASGAEAMAKAIQYPIDLAFIDFEISALDGVATISAWEEIQPNTRFVIMASGKEAQDAKKLLKNGSNAWLPKPVNRMDVFSIMAKIMKRAAAVS